MGLKAFFTGQTDAPDPQKQAERDAAVKAKIQWTPEKTAKLTSGPRATFEHLSLSSDGKAVNGYPVKGAHAEVELGGQGSRTTATRVVVGTILAPGVGTIVGAVAKKNQSMVYVTVTLADGHVLAAESKVKNESVARRFANAVNQASR